MDGEVAQLAALVISANHRLANPDDPMAWFVDQRAFASCGRIGFRAAKKGLFGKPCHVPVADTPLQWLDLLATAQVERVVMTCTRQDSGEPNEDSLPDRLAAGFAGGGSLWAMSSETKDGGALCWEPGWRAAFPEANDGRIWEATYMAQPCQASAEVQVLSKASEALHQALTSSRDFATELYFDQVAGIFSSAMCLLEGAVDPKPVPRPAGPADTLTAPARNLLFAGQRGWVFDNLSLWKDQDFSPDVWARYAALSEALYCAVTGAITAAVNSSVSKA